MVALCSGVVCAACARVSTSSYVRVSAVKLLSRVSSKKILKSGKDEPEEQEEEEQAKEACGRGTGGGL